MPDPDSSNYNIIQLSNVEKEHQKSKRNKLSFLMFGIGMLLPWNVMLAAMDYFTEKFPSYKPSFSLLVAVSVPMLLVQLLAYFFL